jgi:hypothetical protein
MDDGGGGGGDDDHGDDDDDDDDDVFLHLDFMKCNADRKPSVIAV